MPGAKSKSTTGNVLFSHEAVSFTLSEFRPLIWTILDLDQKTVRIAKRERLPMVKDPVAIEWMHTLKAALDPNGILQSGEGALASLTSW